MREGAAGAADTNTDTSVPEWYKLASTQRESTHRGGLLWAIGRDGQHKLRPKLNLLVVFPAASSCRIRESLEVHHQEARRRPNDAELGISIAKYVAEPTGVSIVSSQLLQCVASK